MSAQEMTSDSTNLLEPYEIAIPRGLASDVDRLVDLFVRREGYSHDRARRLVELSILHAGVAKVLAMDRKALP